MASSTVCWGIEIGAAAIKAIKLENAGEGRVKVLDFAVVQHPKVLSTPGVDANDVLRVSLGQFVNAVDLSKASVAVSVPGHSAFARFAKLPPVEPKKIPDVVKFEAMQQIPFPLEQVEWDFQTFLTPDSPDVEVGIFAITKERVQERLQMLGDLGITPNFVVLSPIAVYNALAYDLDFAAQTPGTIIVDVGTTSTDLVIATPGKMWVRTFPLGGHQFTQALVDQFQLSYPKAEKVKREAEDSQHARQIFQAMRPIFTDLAQDIQRSIGYFQSLNKDATLTRLIGVGSTFALPGLRKYLKQQLSLDVYRVEQFKKATMEGERAAAFNESSLGLTTAYGLALQGLGLNAVGGNLMPTSVIRKAMWKEKVPWFAVAACAAVAAGGAMFIRPIMDSTAVKAKLPDPIIQKVVGRAGQLKSEADAAGVTGSGEPDMRAAQLIGLADRRDVINMIVHDVQDMMIAADERAKTWADFVKAPAAPAGPAYSLVSFKTAYEPPTTGSWGGDAGATPGAATDPLEVIRPFAKVRCDMKVSTKQPEARRFVKETIERWLRDHQKRDGVPYQVYVSDPVFALADAAGAAAGDPGAIATGAPSGFGGRPGSRPEDIMRSSPEGIPGRTFVIGGESPPSSSAPGETNLTKAAAAARDEVNRAAPLTPPPELAKSKAEITGFATLHWYIAFVTGEIKPAEAAPPPPPPPQPAAATPPAKSKSKPPVPPKVQPRGRKGGG